MKNIVILSMIMCLFAMLSSSEENQNVVSGNNIKGAENLNWPGIYRPTTDLNNFEYSTLGKDKGGKVTGSSIGYSKKSVDNNVNLNKKIQSEIKDDEEYRDANEITYSSSGGLSPYNDGTVLESIPINEISEVGNTMGKGKVIQWTDENGVVHVTNDPTQVYIKSKELN